MIGHSGRDAPTPTHWLRGNASEWTPGRVAFFDTETRATHHDGTETLALRLWCGGVVDRRRPAVPGLSVRYDQGHDRASLAGWVDTCTVGARTTWLYAHNLGFDLTVSRLPDQLHRLGWTMGQWQFAGRNVAGTMRKGVKRLRLCDSASLLPHPLEHVGRQLGRHKLPMPAQDAPEAAWLAYCSQDTLILAEAILTLMDWWDREKLGHWTASGPGLGWNAMRHRMGERAFLIDTENGGPAVDRPAIRGGRRDITRVGEIEGGPFALVDFSNAYLTVAAHMPLPRRRLGHYADADTLVKRAETPGYDLCAEIKVGTDVPRYPFRNDTGVFYPVGRFRTLLCGPEIADAQRRGDIRSIGAGWIHDCGMGLAPWAQWCLDQMEADNDVVPAVVRLMVKQWGRSVIGRFAARQSRTLDLGPALYPGWHLTRGSTGPDHAPAADVHIAGRHWWYQMDREGENAYPAVLAWVESYVRVALNRMLDALGPDLWVCCDTDGAVLDLTKARSWLGQYQWPLGRLRGPMTVAEAVCEAIAPLTAPLVPRVKLLSETLTVSGPQHYAGDSFERAAGRPGKPEIDADGTLRWWSWPKVAWQMQNGSPEGYVRTEVHWTHPSQLAHRWVLDGGLAVPVTAEIGPDGTSRLVPWERTALADLGAKLHPSQAPALRGLW